MIKKITDKIPSAIALQTLKACDVIKTHLSRDLRAIHLYGSSVSSGLKPYSDIDLMVTIDNKLELGIRKKLMFELSHCSAPRGSGSLLRPLEVTIVSTEEVFPWRYPAIREMQFGEWLREPLMNGLVEPAAVDIDLAILLTMVNKHGLVLYGRDDERFEEIPLQDFNKALLDTLKTWRSEEDWSGEESDVILALARIWFSAATKSISSKEFASTWLAERLPERYKPILNEAQQVYLTGKEHHLTKRAKEVSEFIKFAKAAISGLMS